MVQIYIHPGPKIFGVDLTLNISLGWCECEVVLDLLAVSFDNTFITFLLQEKKNLDQY